MYSVVNHSYDSNYIAELREIRYTISLMTKIYDSPSLPNQVDMWRGEISNPLNQSNTIFIALHYPPIKGSEYNTGYFDKFVPIASLPEQCRELARTALELTCIVELNEDRSRVLSVKKYNFVESPSTLDTKLFKSE